MRCKMKLLRTVTIKHIVTEEKKAEIIAEFEAEITQSERELEQLTFQLHKATKDIANKHEQLALRARYKEEMKQREEKLRTISFKVQQLHKLELGSEISAGTADSIVEVEVGDHWPDLDQKTELIIKNGIVHEIRESRSENDELV